MRFEEIVISHQNAFFLLQLSDFFRSEAGSLKNLV